MFHSKQDAVEIYSNDVVGSMVLRKVAEIYCARGAGMLLPDLSFFLRLLRFLPDFVSLGTSFCSSAMGPLRLSKGTLFTLTSGKEH